MKLLENINDYNEAVELLEADGFELKHAFRTSDKFGVTTVLEVFVKNKKKVALLPDGQFLENIWEDWSDEDVEDMFSNYEPEYDNLKLVTE